jgi:hypothetical protein
MHCMACGTEMRLRQVARGLMVPDCEHLTLHCISCDEIERRFVFRRATAEPVPIRIARPRSPTRAGRVWARAVACLRGRRWIDLSKSALIGIESR